VNRRQLLAVVGVAALQRPVRFRAVAYDGFTLFDPRPIGAVAARWFSSRAPELMTLWRTKQFDYQWLRSLSGRYADFWQSTEDALRFAARSLQLPLTPEARDALMGAWLERAFDDVISTDRNRSFKPDPRAYQLGVSALGFRREEIVFAPSAGWDVAGARWFGFPTFWVNRLYAPEEELGVSAEASGAAMAELVSFATRGGAR
jgi:2-haloacid dehalogenase